MKNVTRCVLLLCVAAMTTGCLKFKQVWSINPDGSGKLAMTMAVSEQMLAMAGPEEDPFASFTAAEMIDEEQRGWVAFTEPKIETVNGFKTATMIGYFTDINQVRFSSDEGGEEDQMKETTYAFEEGKLTVIDTPLAQMLQSMAEDESMNDPQMKAMMTPMMAGLEISEAYILPGEVESAEGYATEGPQAMAMITDKDVLAAETPRIEGLEDGQLVITYDPAGWDGKEDAWKAELEAAKAEWAKLKEKAAVGANAEAGADTETEAQ